MMDICIFEDRGYKNLLPLAHLRPVYDLKCGITSLRDKIIRSFPNSKVVLHSRHYLAEVLKRDYPDYLVNKLPTKREKVLFINGRVVADDSLEKILKYEGKDCVFMIDSTVAAVWLSGQNLERVKELVNDGSIFEADFSQLVQKPIKVTIIRYPWDLVSHNGDQIVADFNQLTNNNPQILGQIYEGVHLVNSSQIHISEGTKVKPGGVLDAEAGPIYIGENVKIFPNAVIEGPAYIGDNSFVKIGAKIYENTSVHKVCKVGGEVEATIIDAYSNKQHEGFIGHAYLGSWVNIGGDTNNSDLKNNYGNVKVFINGEFIDTGSMFIGLTMGDHSKTAINSMFNTGTVVGVCCNVYGSGMPPKFVPSFSWGGAEELTTYQLDKAMEVAKRVMGRRKVQLTDVDERLFKTVFELTQKERQWANIW